MRSPKFVKITKIGKKLRMSKNIKVCLRIKPPLDPEKSLYRFSKRKEDRQKNPRSRRYFFTLNKKNKKIKKTKVFDFDQIFSPGVNQQQVYEEFKEELLQSALNGVSAAFLKFKRLFCNREFWS